MGGALESGVRLLEQVGLEMGEGQVGHLGTELYPQFSQGKWVL